MKLTLTIKSGTLTGQVFILNTGHMTIGRAEYCTVRFDPFGEKIASKQHAFIEARPDGFYITDNGSTNGTIVNGQKIQSAKLNSGDIIQFGTKGVEGTVNIEFKGAAEALTEEAIGDEIPQDTFDQMQANQIDRVQRHSHQSVSQSLVSVGLGNLEVIPEQRNTGKYVGIAITLFVIVFLAMIVSLIIFLSLGPIAAVFAAIIAFVPAIFYLFPFIWLDRYDPEPLWLLALTFAWGALVAIFFSFILNTAVGVGVTVVAGQDAGTIAGAVLAAPFFEELSKGAGLLAVVLFFRKYFDGILDGIIFAGMVALGFATVENVLYYGRALLAGGLGGLIGIFFMRGILSPFAHVTFTAMTGIGLGLARESHNQAVKFIAPLVGLFFAMFLHAFWNGVAVFFGGGFLVVYLLIEIPFFLIFVAFSFWIMWRQNRIIREMLAIDVARGLIPEEHFEKATSAFKSTGWLIGSVFEGKFRATNKYIKAIGKLGLSYWHIQRATAAQGQTASFQQNPVLREEVLKWRDQV